MVGYLIIITILLVFSLTLIIINSRMRKNLKSIKDSREDFIKQIDLLQNDKKKEEEIKLKRETKFNEKAELFLKDIILDLDKEGIGIIVSSINEVDYGNVSFNGKKEKQLIDHGKQVIFSYDSKKDMHELFLFKEHQFIEKYKSRISYDLLLKYVRAHYDDKELLRDIITEKIKKILAENLMKELTEDKDDEKSKLEELRKKAFSVLSPVSTNNKTTTKNNLTQSDIFLKAYREALQRQRNTK